MANADRTAKDIIAEAEDLLRTAAFGLEDMTTRRERARAGLRNAVVFGRTATWALQNLRSVSPDFDAWYAAKQAQMKADPLMRFFHNLRTEIEKKASTPSSMKIRIGPFSSADIERLKPAPPGTVGFFVGEISTGGSGWKVRKPDGSIERYYVDLPGVVTIELGLPTAPKKLPKVVPPRS